MAERMWVRPGDLADPGASITAGPLKALLHWLAALRMTLFRMRRPVPRSAPQRARWLRSAQRGNAWHAVTIARVKSDCPACSVLKDARFLSAQAPRLPPAGCDQPQRCKCVYRHFPDRRAGPRRADEESALYPQAARRVVSRTPQDRRDRHGRRATDRN